MIELLALLTVGGFCVHCGWQLRDFRSEVDLDRARRLRDEAWDLRHRITSGSRDDPRIARIERGMGHPAATGRHLSDRAVYDLADLRAWQEIAERHVETVFDACPRCWEPFPCADRQAADAAIDRLAALWGTAP